MNAVKHGLTAKCILIGDEDPVEFDALRNDLAASFQISSGLGQELVNYLAGSLWRLRRAPLMEAAVIREALEAAEENAKAERLRCKGFPSSAHQEVYDKIEAMRRRLYPDVEGEHSEDQSEANTSAEEQQEVVEELPEEDRQRLGSEPSPRSSTRTSSATSRVMRLAW
jgi:hypothetical protein